MHRLKSRCLTLLIGLLLTFSTLAQLINHLVYNFPGNSYFPEKTLLSVLLLTIVYAGLMLVFGKDSHPSKQGKELVYFFSILSLIAFATNAVQLTPFPIIDHHIIAVEEKLNINMAAIISWASQFPHFIRFLNIIYNSLAYQMGLIPLLMIALKKYQLLKEYYFLMLCTVILGFLFYYFFPTTAPASNVISPFFTADQIATGLKFNQIHNHIVPTTNAGGLIALPSFHVIWAFIGVYLLKEWPISCVLLGIINVFLAISCVLLGWHYPLDVLGGFLILGLSYSLMRRCQVKR